MSDTAEREYLPHVKLHFNIKHPDLEDCYIAGYECGLNNKTEEENPYDNSSREYELWSDGWWAAFYGEEALFELKPESNAANDKAYSSHDISRSMHFLNILIKITGALAATAVVGYHVFELVA